MPGPDGKVVVITGAGSGLGRAMARRLLQDGHRVALAGRTASTLTETAGGGAEALVVPTDVTDPTEVGELFKTVSATWGRVDLLVNNAGLLGRAGSVDQLTLADWEEALAVNLIGAALCAGEAVRRMKTQIPCGGRIVNNGSLSAQLPRPGSAVYTVTKHAVAGLTKALALDGRAFAISCTQLDIGNAATAMTSTVALQARQPDGSLRAEPTFDPVHVADVIGLLARFPTDVSVPHLTIIATGMPFAGRG